MKRVNVVVTCAAISWGVFSACSVFEAPLTEEASGGSNGSGGGSDGGNGSGGVHTSSGGNLGSGGLDGSVSGGGTPSGTGGSSATGGAAQSSGGKADSGGGGAPATGPFWLDTDSNGCVHARLPTKADRPKASDPGADLPPITLAMSRARHGASADNVALTNDEDGWVDTGFDVDGVCSSSPSCEVDEVRVKDTACKNGLALPLDGNLCRDNAIGKVINVANRSPFVGEYFGMNDPDWNCELRRGGFSGIIKISNYNGKLNDSSVRVDIYTSVGLQVGLGWNCRSKPGQPLDVQWPEHATWTKDKHWKIAERVIDIGSPPTTDPNELPRSIVYDQTAFVRNGYLVAYFPENSEFWWNGENTPVPGFRDIMHHPVAVSKLIQNDDETWSIDEGTLTSIVLPGEMLNGFREIGYCENMCDAYSTMTGYLNGATDVFRDPGPILPDTPCEGLSIAIDFEAREATATKQDIVKVKEPVDCPQPRHPAAPRQGCTCVNGSCKAGDPGYGDAGPP